jgi:hypothetical protein
MKQKLEDEDQDLKEGKERQRRYREEAVKEDEEIIRKDLLILNYFDTKPCLEPLDNIYQIPIVYPTPYPPGYKGQIAGEVYLRLCENHDLKINVKGLFTHVRINSEYVEGFLNHHYKYYEGNKKDFLNHFFDSIILGRTVLGELNQYTPNKSFIDSWVNSKRISDTDSKRIKRSSVEISKPLFKEDYNPDIYLKVLKDVKPPILNSKGEFIRGINSKSKGSIVAWCDILEAKSKINNHNSDTKAKLINFLIPNLQISGRSFGYITEAYNKYYNDIDDLISKMK